MFATRAVSSRGKARAATKHDAMLNQWIRSTSAVVPAPVPVNARRSEEKESIEAVTAAALGEPLISTFRRQLHRLSTAEPDAQDRRQLIADVRRTLQTLLVAADTPSTSSASDSVVSAVLDAVKAILKVSVDPQHRVRAEAIECVRTIIIATPLRRIASLIAVIVPTLIYRLSRQNISAVFAGEVVMPMTFARTAEETYATSESSEDLRLALFTLLTALIDRSRDANDTAPILRVLPDCLTVMAQCLTDSFVALKLVSCDAITALFTHFAPFIRHAAPLFIRIAAHTLIHPQAKVRRGGITTISALVMNGGAECIRDLTAFREANVIDLHAFYHGETRFNFIAKLITDAHADVRRATYNALSLWATKLYERTDYETLIVPYLISALGEQHTDIVEIAMAALFALGEEYESDHEDDLRNVKAYEQTVEQETRSHTVSVPFIAVKPFTRRPSLGQRLYMKRFIDRLMHAALHELTDWNGRVQRNSLQLVATLIVHGEEAMTAHARHIIDAFIAVHQKTTDKQTNTKLSDDERESLRLMSDCARLLGRYVDAPTLISAITQATTAHTNAALVILQDALSGISGDAAQWAAHNVIAHCNQTALYQTDDVDVIRNFIAVVRVLHRITCTEPSAHAELQSTVAHMTMWITSSPTLRKHVLTEMEQVQRDLSTAL